MNLEYVPLLPVQRDLHGVPRGPGRFREYLRTIFPGDGTVAELLPLLAMNPMGKGHVTALLDGLLAADADPAPGRRALVPPPSSASLPVPFAASRPAYNDGR